MKYLPIDTGPEFRRVQTWTENPGVPFLLLDELKAAPAKPVEGMVVFADGVTWNPGAGRGVYAYHGAAWRLLG